jgi:Domain of unknown function (DUF6457)
MDDWIDHLAGSLGEEPISPEELGAVLRLARDVAHGVERKLAPVSTYLAGVHAGRTAAAGGTRAHALTRAVEAARRLIPEPSEAAGAEAGGDGSGGDR